MIHALSHHGLDRCAKRDLLAFSPDQHTDNEQVENVCADADRKRRS